MSAAVGPRWYRLVLRAAAPIVRRWGRLQVSGEQLLMHPGPVLLVGNHDSFWDPVVIGIAALERRQIQALAKAGLWRVPPLGWVLDRMGQLKVTRGVADRRQLNPIIRLLRSQGCVGIFPEGQISKGRPLRAYSGAGWLVGQVPQTRVVAVAVTGVVDLARFPTRPRIRVQFFEPAGGQRHRHESSVGFSRRVLAEVRDRAPAVTSGRRRPAPSTPQLQPSRTPNKPAYSRFFLQWLTLRRTRRG